MYQIMEIAASDNTFPKYDHKNESVFMKYVCHPYYAIEYNILNLTPSLTHIVLIYGLLKTHL